jgi:hypothetical protein
LVRTADPLAHHYRLAGEEAVVGLLLALSRVGERNSAEVARVMASYFRARDELEPVSRDELLARLRAGTATVLDVRPEDEFGAVSGRRIFLRTTRPLSAFRPRPRR